MVYRPGESPLELITLETAKKVNQFFSNIKKDVRKRFKNMKLVQILEFPVLFLGSKTKRYTFFLQLYELCRLWFGNLASKNGMYSVILAMETLAKRIGCQNQNQCECAKIEVTKMEKHRDYLVNNKIVIADVILSGADYHHSETLLEKNIANTQKFIGKTKHLLLLLSYFMLGLIKN